MKDIYVLVNGRNYFNEESLAKMIDALNDGKMIDIYIDCIGHTRTEMESLAYVESLKEHFGEDNLIRRSIYTHEYYLKEYKEHIEKAIADFEKDLD